MQTHVSKDKCEKYLKNSVIWAAWLKEHVYRKLGLQLEDEDSSTKNRYPPARPRDVTAHNLKTYRHKNHKFCAHLQLSLV